MADVSGAESLAYEIFCVIYRLHGTSWVVLGGTSWAQFQVIKNDRTNAFRVVAWIPPSEESSNGAATSDLGPSASVPPANILLSFPITATCHVKRKASDFIRITDPDGVSWGMGFYTKGECAREPAEALRILSGAIEAQQPHKTTPQKDKNDRRSSRNLGDASVGAAAAANAALLASPPAPERPRRDTVKAPSTTTPATLPANAFAPLKQQLAHDDSASGGAPAPVPPRPVARTASADVLQAAHHAQQQQQQQQQKQSHQSQSHLASGGAFSTAATPAPAQAPSPAPTTAVASPASSVVSALSTSAPAASSAAGASSGAAGGSLGPWEHEPTPHSPDAPVSDAYRATVGSLGILTIFPEKPAKRASASGPPAAVSSRARSPGGEDGEDDAATAAALASVDITSPVRVSHDWHATHDPSTGVFHGIPQDWEHALHKQFAVPLPSVDMIRLPQYPERVPRVLYALFSVLRASGGTAQEGIFRLAPEGGSTAAARAKIDAGALIGKGATVDANGVPVFPEAPDTVATLIKIWFRELPEKLLDRVPQRVIMECSGAAEAWRVVQSLSEPWRSTCAYLIDECVHVTRQSAVNKMTPQNLGIVIGPNLFVPDDANPMNSLAYSQKVAAWLKGAIEYRLANPDCAL